MIESVQIGALSAQFYSVSIIAEHDIRVMTIPELSTMSRYLSPINPAVFPHLTIVLLGIGLFFTAWFFVYEVRTSNE